MNQLINDRAHVCCLVFGDTPDAREAASRADVRASSLPGSRCVIWVADLRVPDPGDLARWRTDVAVLATFLSLKGGVTAQLKLPEATSFGDLEDAFEEALHG